PNGMAGGSPTAPLHQGISLRAQRIRGIAWRADHRPRPYTTVLHGGRVADRAPTPLCCIVGTLQTL
ncbi:MAG: hypothetical protein MUD01_17885, partial [Chloroflexaceae bacterium]|nr:hypothetical protein [Chloroflexaceae bacterium]